MRALFIKNLAKLPDMLHFPVYILYTKCPNNREHYMNKKLKVIGKKNADAVVRSGIRVALIVIIHKCAALLHIAAAHGRHRHISSTAKTFGRAVMAGTSSVPPILGVVCTDSSA